MSRSLNAEHQPRTLRIAGKLDEPQRISRADEAILVTQARRKAVADDLARIESELQAQLSKLRADRELASRQTYRDIGNAIALIGKTRWKLT